MRRARCLTFLLLTLGGCSCDGGDLVANDGRLEARPDPVDLGRVAVGLAGRSVLFLTNVGEATLSIARASVSDSLMGELRLDQVPAGLPPQASTEVQILFAPTARGPREGEIYFDTDSRSLPRAVVRVVGLAIDPRLVAEPAVVDFGRVVVGRTATASVELENRGDVPLSVAAITGDLGTSPEFAAFQPGILALLPGERARVRLEYQPADAGVDEGTLLVNDDSPLPERLAIRVRGEGVSSELEIDPTEIQFSGVFVGELRTRRIDLRNLGPIPHTVTRLELVRTATGGELRVVTSTRTTTPFQLAPGELVSVAVAYQPRDVQSDFDQVRIESTGLTVPAFVNLIGQAVASPVPDVDVTPPRLDFGLAQVGSISPREVRVANFGGADLTLRGLVEIDPPTAPYRLVGPPPADLLLQPLDTHAFTVEFSPTALGAAPAAELVVRSDDPDEGEVRVPISGTGQGAPLPDVEVTPSPVVFGQVPRGVAAGRAVTIRNVGSGLLTVSQVSLPGTAGGRFSLPVLPVIPLSLAPGGMAQLQVGYADPAGLSGLHMGTLRVLCDDPDEATTDVALIAETVPPPVGSLDLAMTLRWDSSGTDVDLHLVRPAGAYFDRPSDCCYCNPNPDWGVLSQGTDNPFLDVDDIDGLGPENINLQAAASGDYRVFVHYFSDHGQGGSTVAEVTLSSQGMSLGSHSRALSNGQVWEVGTFTMAGGAGSFVPAGVPVQASTFSSCF